MRSSNNEVIIKTNKDYSMPIKDQQQKQLKDGERNVPHKHELVGAPIIKVWVFLGS